MLAFHSSSQPFHSRTDRAQRNLHGPHHKSPEVLFRLFCCLSKGPGVADDLELGPLLTLSTTYLTSLSSTHLPIATSSPMSNGQYYNGGPPAGQPHPLSSYDQPYAPPPPVQYDQPRQSFQDHTSDYHLPDDTRSFDSQTYLQPGGPGQYDVGSVVPTNQYPPQPSPSPQSWRNSIMGGGPPTPGPRADWYGYEGTEGSGFRQAYATLMGRRPTMKVPRGNYVVDVPAPSQIRSDEAEHNEMKHLRYSAATCDPDDFMRNKFTLRPYLWGRRTELFVGD